MRLKHPRDEVSMMGTTRHTLNSVREDSAKIQSMWKENSSFRLSDVSFDDFSNLLNRIDVCTKRISDFEATLIADRLERNRLLTQANDVCTRVRSMARGFFGPDTTQLKQTGHTIRSERKSPVRKSADAGNQTTTARA